VAAQKRNNPKPHNDNFLERPQVGVLEVARRRILECGAGAEFYALVNCAPDLLLILLSNLLETPILDTWSGRFGFEYRELKRIPQQMRRTARYLERLQKANALQIVAWPNFKDRCNPVEFLAYVTSLPESLTVIARNLDKAVKHPLSQPRAHPLSNTALAQLVCYVLHCTGAPHDNEVSALVNAVRHDTPDKTYTADALKTWRHEHTRTIQNAPKLFPSLFAK
jgi:hypothetical protein